MAADDTKGVTLADWRNAARKFTHGEHVIACWLGGNATRRPLLLLHGFPTASHDWAAVWDGLGHRHGLIAADMLGFGLSDKPKGGFAGSGYSIHGQADMQEALLAHLGIGEYDILAHDYGVSVAQEMLARQLEGSGAGGLGQIVFLNGGLFPDQHRLRPIQRLGTSRLGPLVSRGLTSKKFGKSFSEVFGPRTQPSAQELDDYWWLITRKGGHRLFHKLLHYIADRKAYEARWVGALKTAPERIGYINGALDPVSGKHSYEAWRARLPGARHRLLPGVGHYPQIEAPKAVIDSTLEWLN
ncbi:MAG: alpha/beta hydrolase [Parerythrobacter sp.]